MHRERGTAVGRSPRGVAASIPEPLSTRRLDVDVFDIAILGAGCAGLSSCLALLEAGFSGPIVLIDSRRTYLDDRTWCFWDVEPTPFSHLARARWDTWKVASADTAVEVSAPTTPYLCLAATDFYRFALDSIAAFPNVELRLGESVGDLRDDDDLAHVITAAGVLRARHLVDSRGFSASHEQIADARASSTWVAQQFLGLHIVADRPVFDPTECTLMDFDVDQSGGLRFMYVLPTSTSEALIEDVYMADTLLDADGYHGEIEQYLLQEFGLQRAEYEVVGQERGYIPMTDHRFTRRVSPRITALGTAGGATRPSTGYTFLAIQRSVVDLVDRIIGGAPDAVEPSCSLLDAVFLRFLADHPKSAPRIFSLLFGRVPTPSLVRFLTERSGMRDHLRLILALPKIPFLRTAVKVLATRVARGRRRR